MAVPNDPKKIVIPHSASADAPPVRADKASKDTATKPKKSDFDNFDSMSITMKDALELQEAVAERDAEQTEEANDIAKKWSEDHSPFNDDKDKLLTADEMELKGTLTLADMMRIDPNDQRAISMRTGVVTDYEAGKKYYVVGKDLEKFEARRAAESYLRNPSEPQRSTQQQPHFEVRSAGNIQSDLVASINRAAKITGVPPALLGAMAGIESGFNDPKMQKSPTGAIGVVQQTGGYRDTVWAKYGDIVAQYVPEAREAMKDGLDKNEKRKLAFNEDAAFIIVGLRAKELEKKYGIDMNTPKGMALVYLEHNSGEGSVKRLLNGQMTDATIRGYNPAIYKGNDTPEAVFAATERKMSNYGKSYEKMAARIEASPAYAAANPEADTVIARASASSAEAIKSGAVASIGNVKDANMDARDIKIAQRSGPALIPS